MTLHMDLGRNGYDIVIESGCLQTAGKALHLNRKVLIVTDEGVPERYASAVAAHSREPLICRVPQGEDSKSFRVLEQLLSRMLSAGFGRGDCVCAVGGGVCGDLAGFAAASYMRGDDFNNLPTTVLSQVDSSIGGKTAINLGGIKNVVGAFYQPKKVLIDVDTLATLPPRQISAGLAEAVKMSLTSDPALFSLFETADPAARMEEIITASLRIKQAVVEQDETEQGLRKILNFGHTVGHGIESVTGLYHGECVALGMLPMCSDAVRPRLKGVLETLGLPTSVRADPDKVYAAMLHDKKAGGGNLTVIRVEHIGDYVIETVAPESLRPLIDMVARR